MDDMSKAIIEQLQQDGRRPYAAIGKAVGLSEAAVRQRVQRLLDSGVMQIVAVTDPMQLGFARAAMIGIRGHGDAEQVADQLDRVRGGLPRPHAPAPSTSSPRWWREDDDHLLELINRKIRAIPGVRSTETLRLSETS